MIITKMPLIIALALSTSALGACASIVEGTDQSISISSSPPGATCLLERGGSQIGVVNPAPGTVQIDKSSEDITVRCAKEDYNDGVAVLSSSFEGMTAGNVIFGGIIGLGVDAASGAMHTYPSSILVTLPPK